MTATGRMRRTSARLKGRMVRAAGSSVAAVRRRATPATLRPGTTVVTVNWNSVEFLRPMLEAVVAMSPRDTEILVVDNGSTDGSRDFLASRPDLRAMLLPVNVGHGVALDLALPTVSTEYIAVLDVDAFPISDRWLSAALASLADGAQIAGARMIRNFVHPCYLVTRTDLIHRFGLTLRPVGSLDPRPSRAPLFLDVGEALSQRVMIRFGGTRALRFFEPTSIRGPGSTGTVFGDLVYHNLYATQGVHHGEALRAFREAFADYHPALWESLR